MFILLLLLWIVFNGKCTLEIFLFGIGFSALIYAFLCKFTDYSVKKDIKYFTAVPLVILYLLNLIWEIILANIHILPFLFKSTKKQHPVLVKYKTSLKTPIARFVLANSITLTPGTITVELNEDELTIHCLDKSLCSDTDESSFVKLLKKMEARING